MRISRLLIVAVIVLIFAIATVFMNGKALPDRRATTAIPKPQAAATNGAIRVWLHGDDIYPNHVRMAPGTVMLVAENQASSDFTLIVERVGPGQAPQLISTLSAAAHLNRAKRTLTLSSGHYVFYERSRPDVKGEMIVE